MNKKDKSINEVLKEMLEYLDRSFKKDNPSDKKIQETKERIDDFFNNLRKLPE